MRILHVTEASNAGVGGHIIDLMEGQPEQNCEVHFAYSPRRVDDYFQKRIETLPLDLLTQIPMRRLPHWSDIAASKAILRCIHEHGPFDIIHAHSTKAGGICRIGTIKTQASIVYTPNGIYSMNMTSNAVLRRAIQFVECRLAKQSDAIVAVSPEEQQHMVRIGLPADRIHMVPNGLRPISWPSRASVRMQLGIPEDQLLFGFLGRLVAQKNPQLLLRAFAIVKDIPAIRLVIVGVGDLESDCRQLARELKIEDQIYWLGYRTAPEAMPAFDVFMMPSRYEGMPYVMMEALSLGLPVVATPVGGTSLAIQNDENGFIVPFDSPEAMANAMRSLSKDNIRATMSTAALHKSRDFSVDLMVERTNDIYQIALQKNNSGQHS